MQRPERKPARPFFSSGPCPKRSGWDPAQLRTALAGRSHRSEAGQARIREVLDRSHRLLALPADYRVALLPGSDTGAMEAALWSLLGARGVDVLAWESFGRTWARDITGELRLPDVRVLDAGYGDLPDLRRVDCDRDVVFVWNGTSSGVRVPDAGWIPDERAGLTICDATSAVFAMALPWRKLDVITYSWQKVLGGEGAHGMLILGPRAVERLEDHTPAWPIPKLFRLARNGRLDEDLFHGRTLNTPSMLCVEDQLQALHWAESVGGVPALAGRAERNLDLVAAWVESSPWAEFLAKRPETRSSTSVCLAIVAPWFAREREDAQWRIVKHLCRELEAEQVAYDIAAYRDAPPGLRIWCGPTVDHADLAALLPWLDWAFERTCADSVAS